jgi:hypothetical protein
MRWRPFRYRHGCSLAEGMSPNRSINTTGNRPAGCAPSRAPPISTHGHSQCRLRRDPRRRRHRHPRLGDLSSVACERHALSRPRAPRVRQRGCHSQTRLRDRSRRPARSRLASARVRGSQRRDFHRDGDGREGQSPQASRRGWERSAFPRRCGEGERGPALRIHLSRSIPAPIRPVDALQACSRSCDSPSCSPRYSWKSG